LLVSEQHSGEPCVKRAASTSCSSCSVTSNFGLPAQFPEDDVAGALANAIDEIFASDIEDLDR
jgi:hypothetical protein